MEKRREEMPERMVERYDFINEVVYHALLDILEIDKDQAGSQFPEDVKLIRDAFDGMYAALVRHGYPVCDPYVTTNDQGRVYRCTPAECGNKVCHYQDENMEQERILARVEEALVRQDIMLVETGADSFTVKEDWSDKAFLISVKPLGSEVKAYG